MRYNKQKIFSSSIDWFIFDYNCWIHGASMGGLLPDNTDDRDLLPQFQAICSTLPELMSREDVTINDEIIELRFRRHLDLLERIKANSEENVAIFTDEERDFNSFKNRYCELFIDMAAKGFYSYARINIDNPLDNSYHLIASPSSDAATELRNNMDEYLRLGFITDKLRQYHLQISNGTQSDGTPPDRLF